MMTGGCLCGTVKYKYEGEITEIFRCHCGQCRKAQGTAFVTNAPIDAELFVITQGEEVLKRFYSSPGKERVFCSNCGSPIYSAKDDMPKVKRLRLGTLDTDFVCDNQCHIYVDDKPSWNKITDGFPQYKKMKS